ncbi:MAG: 16S rRNA (guanine(966)-N(2))-methyltransferase RsmD [Mizugakiibacter sp.]|uniref:16S rRNA (guanine(966)-N(2))-methyltransferase RsmD n=1 Tax=Mizugakiibacter sp. TaxID=1972610 RepID=UPI0031C78EA9|nr:16S rRNA (guanine(966)-N(2))-methyltransferase RsmD [Xanthomonadaceae bacterium]
MRRVRVAPSGAGRVRIVAGRLRGSKLAVPDLPGLRPTPDRVRETLFNWLAPTIEGARCLDLFAGTGALGVEALSRGAAHVTFVERDPRLAAALRDNLVRLDQPHGVVECADAQAFLRDAPAPFDLVFLDPPFAEARWADAAAALEAGGWLKPAALVYVEAPADAAPALPAGWTLHREGRAGAVRYALYRRGGAIR